MRRTKTYLRNRMSDERLSSMCLLSIEKELSSTLNLDELTNNFVNLHERRLVLK
jgi:hypothetical protein